MPAAAKTSPSPSPEGSPLEEGPGVRILPPTFRPPLPPRPSQRQQDEPAAAASGGGSGWSGPTPPTLTDPSTPPPPLPPLPVPKGRAKAYTAIAKAALHALSGLINGALAVDEDDHSFLPDDDDDATIPPPAGRLMARRVPIGGSGDDFSELEDIGMLAVGLVAWGLKGVTEHFNARRERGPKGRRDKGVPVFDGTGPAGGDPGNA